MTAIYHTLSKDNAPTPEKTRHKSGESLPVKSKRDSYSPGCNLQRGQQTSKASCHKPNDDRHKRRSCVYCGSVNHISPDCTLYRQGIKSLGFAPEEDDVNQMDEFGFYSGLNTKKGARYLFCSQAHFRMESSSVLKSTEELK